jgi:hypothetical protein
MKPARYECGIDGAETVNAVDSNSEVNKVRGLLPKTITENYDTHP